MSGHAHCRRKVLAKLRQAGLTLEQIEAFAYKTRGPYTYEVHYRQANNTQWYRVGHIRACCCWAAKGAALDRLADADAERDFEATLWGYLADGSIILDGPVYAAVLAAADAERQADGGHAQG